MTNVQNIATEAKTRGGRAPTFADNAKLLAALIALRDRTEDQPSRILNLQLKEMGLVEIALVKTSEGRGAPKHSFVLTPEGVTRIEMLIRSESNNAVLAAETALAEAEAIAEAATEALKSAKANVTAAKAALKSAQKASDKAHAEPKAQKAAPAPVAETETTPETEPETALAETETTPETSTEEVETEQLIEA